MNIYNENKRLYQIFLINCVNYCGKSQTYLEFREGGAESPLEVTSHTVLSPSTWFLVIYMKMYIKHFEILMFIIYIMQLDTKVLQTHLLLKYINFEACTVLHLYAKSRNVLKAGLNKLQIPMKFWDKLKLIFIMFYGTY